MKEPDILTPTITFSPKCVLSPLISEDTRIQTEFLRLIPNLPPEVDIKHPEWVRIQNSVLRKETFIVATFDIERPLFGQIVDILCFDSTILVDVQIYAFLLHSKGEISVLNVCKLQDHRPVVVKSSFAHDDRGLYAFLPYTF